MSGQRVTNEQARLLVESIEATACMRDLGGAPRGFSRDEDETRAVALDLLDCRAKAEALAGAAVQVRLAIYGGPLKCPYCCWPMFDSVDDGCVPGNCSMRPIPNRNPVSDACSAFDAALAAWREGK